MANQNLNNLNAEAKASKNLEEINKRLLEIEKKRSVQARAEREELKKKAEAIEKYLDKLRQSKDLAKELTSDFKDMVDSMSLSSRSTDTMSKMLSVANKNFRGITALAVSFSENVNNTGDNIAEQIAQKTSNYLEAQKSLLNMSSDVTAAEYKQITDQVAKTHEEFKSILNLNEAYIKSQPELLQYVGDLQRSLGKVNQELMITQGLTADEIDQYKQLTAEGEKLKARFKSIGDMIITAIKKPAVLLGAAIMAIGQAVSKLGESFREFGGNLGGAVYSAAALSLVFKEGTNVAKGLASEFGSMKDISFGTQLNTNLMAVNLGISGDEAAKLVGGFARLNKGSIDIAENMVATTKALSEAAGVNTAAVSSDIAQNMAKFSEYSNDGGENLITAGVAAAQLGVNLGTIANISDALLDFQSSITKELEVGALLGKNINFNEARTLLYRGKQASGIRSILKELGGVAAYNDMEYYQRKEVAAMLNISVDELNRMVKNMDKLNEDGSIQLSTFDRMNELMTGILTGPFGGMISAAGALIPLLGQHFFGFRMIGRAVDRVTASIMQMNAAQNSGNATQLLDGDPGQMTKSGKPDRRFKANRLPATPQPSVASNVNQTGGGINMRSVLQGAAAMLILAGALFVFAKAAQEFGGVKWDDVFIGIGAMATLGVVAGVLGIGPVAAAVGTGTLIILGLATAFLIFATAATLMSVAVQGIASVLPQLANSFTPLLSLGAGLLILAGGFWALGASLAGFAALGSVAIPLLLAVGAASVGLGMLMGDSEETTAVEGGSLEQTVKDGLQNVVNAINNKNFDVYLDKSKVTNLIFAEERSKTRNSVSITPRGI
jgi:hypothetical protein